MLDLKHASAPTTEPWEATHVLSSAPAFSVGCPFIQQGGESKENSYLGESKTLQSSEELAKGLLGNVEWEKLLLPTSGIRRSKNQLDKTHEEANSPGEDC